jgi:hypothetical protein
VGLDMLLEILWTLESFTAKVTLVWLEGDMHSNMRRDMIALDSGSTTVAPLASQVQVVGAFATDMAFANVVLQSR